MDKTFWQGVVNADYAVPTTHTRADLTQDEQKPAIAADFAPLVLAALQPMNVG